MSTKIPEIKTKRLVLRPFSLEDVDDLFAVLNEEGILQYFPTSKPPSREGVERFIAGQLKQWDEIGYAWWAVALASDPEKKLMGWNGLQYLPDTDEVEVGFLLSKAYWGQGLTTEGARASVEYGFNVVGVSEIVGIVHPENTASQRVLEKLGMGARKRTVYFEMDVYRYCMKKDDLRTEDTE